MNRKIQLFTQDQLKKDPPVLNIGDNVRVATKIKEGNHERIQYFEGTIIAKRGSGISETFTVRRIAYGVGVEKVFPIHSPNIGDVVITRRGKVRRAKLYYLRDRVGKRSKVKEMIYDGTEKAAKETAEKAAVEE
ncbi:MAG: 50S ribosomal protein L19 [Clostridiales bacterium]|nr:50S ribosomal protein L19 [Clostridiales bacterium]